MAGGCKSYDAENDDKDDLHVKEVEIAESRESSHTDEKVRTLLMQNTLCAENQKGKVNHRIDKIRVHGSQNHGVSAEDVSEASGKNGASSSFHLEAEKGKRKPGEIKPQKDEKAVERFRIAGRCKDGKKIQGISDDIVVKGRQHVGPVADGEIPEGNAEAVFREKRVQDGTSPVSEIEKGVIVLGKSVRFPD